MSTNQTRMTREAIAKQTLENGWRTTSARDVMVMWADVVLMFEQENERFLVDGGGVKLYVQYS